MANRMPNEIALLTGHRQILLTCGAELIGS